MTPSNCQNRIQNTPSQPKTGFDPSWHPRHPANNPATTVTHLPLRSPRLTTDLATRNCKIRSQVPLCRCELSVGWHHRRRPGDEGSRCPERQRRPRTPLHLPPEQLPDLPPLWPKLRRPHLLLVLQQPSTNQEPRHRWIDLNRSTIESDLRAMTTAASPI